VNKFLVLACLLAISLVAKSQKHASCCSAGAATTFAVLAANPAFAASHAAPVPYEKKRASGYRVQFETADRKPGRAFIRLADSANQNWVLFFHEWWGLNDYITAEAGRFGTEMNVNVMAIDLYDGKVAGTPDSAAMLTQSVKEARIRNIIQGALNFLPAQASVYTLGWCFGGGWSLQAAMMAQPRTKGCVVYYGMPELNPAKVASIHFPVLGIYGRKDEFITTSLVDSFKTLMNLQGKNLAVAEFDAVHAFANPSNPKHDPELANQANARARQFVFEIKEQQPAAIWTMQDKLAFEAKLENSSQLAPATESSKILEGKKLTLPTKKSSNGSKKAVSKTVQTKKTVQKK